jgi:exosortase
MDKKPMKLRAIVFAAYTLALLGLNVDALRAVIALANRDQTASHVIAVPLVSLALIGLSRKEIFAGAHTAIGSGLTVLLMGAGILLIGSVGYLEPGADALAAHVAGFLVCWIGGFVLTFGVPAGRRAAFPLAFLLFAIPPPPAVVAAAIAFLKSGSSATVAGLFTLTGTPYYRQGNVFSLPGVVIEVADECSGIRSSIALLLTCLLAGYLSLRQGWTRAALLLAMVPIALLKNGVRIVSLSLLSIHVDPAFLTGQLHHDGGVVFFLLALALMAPVLGVLRWLDAKSAPLVTALPRATWLRGASGPLPGPRTP